MQKKNPTRDAVSGTFKNYSLSGDLTKICREFPTFQRSAVPLHHISRNFSCESLCVCAHWREEIGSSCGGPVISYPPAPPPHPPPDNPCQCLGEGGRGPHHTLNNHKHHAHTSLTHSTHTQHSHAALTHSTYTQYSHTSITHSTHTQRSHTALTQTT